MSLVQWIALIVIAGTLVGVAIGRYPWLRMNRATIALVGATLLIIIGAISLEEAYQALDLNTLLLLFAMMVLNVNLRLAGFFHLVSNLIQRQARSPRLLLIASSGLLSAIFLNDTIVLMFTPLVLNIVLSLKRNPIPYLVGLVSAANIGSAAAITGNPQNMLIGLSSGIPFLRFTGFLLPVSLAGLVIAWMVLIVVYRQEFSQAFPEAIHIEPARVYKPLLQKSLVASGMMIVAFVLGAPIPLAALSSAALLLITRRLKPRRIFLELDWSLLVFFGSLFMVTQAINTAGFTDQLFQALKPIAEQGVVPLSIISVILSNLVSNVPAVMLFRSLVPGFSQPEQTWLTLAMATTLAGNLTLLGSVANLIVAELARNQGVHLSFKEYLRAGLPITLVSLSVGIVWLSIVF